MFKLKYPSQTSSFTHLSRVSANTTLQMGKFNSCPHPSILCWGSHMVEWCTWWGQDSYHTFIGLQSLTNVIFHLRHCGSLGVQGGRCYVTPPWGWGGQWLNRTHTHTEISQFGGIGREGVERGEKIAGPGGGKDPNMLLLPPHLFRMHICIHCFSPPPS